METIPLTEEENPSTADLDTLDTHELLHRINDEDRKVAWAVEREIDGIASAVDVIAERLASGGRLHYFGAGTSGRLGMLDAAELPPTFSTDPSLVVAHVAGGAKALTSAAEEAEDEEAAGRAEVEEAALGPGDAVVGISASGAAAYVLGAVAAARARGAITIGITNSPHSPLAEAVHVPIVLLTGPEVLAGSTRLKAGSAQKMALNMISTAVMVKLGKVYGNLMVDLRATNKKLRARALRLTARLTVCDEPAALAALQSSGYRVKTAVVMLGRRCSAGEADALLALAAGSLRAVIGRGP